MGKQPKLMLKFIDTFGLFKWCSVASWKGYLSIVGSRGVLRPDLVKNE